MEIAPHINIDPAIHHGKADSRRLGFMLQPNARMGYATANPSYK